MELREERLRKILEIVEEQGFVEVSQLSRQLFVSSPTIRRDLNTLEERSLIVRSHGGAMKKDYALEGSPYQFRATANQEAKRRLALAASELLRDNLNIFIDESTTVRQMLDRLDSFRNLRVVTNSVAAAQLLAKSRCEVFLLCGKLNGDNMSVVGPYAQESLENFGIDLMFFSSSGLRRDGMIVDYEEQANSLRRKALKLAAETVFICDASKYGRTASFSLAPAGSIDHLVVESPFPEEIPTGMAHVIRA